MQGWGGAVSFLDGGDQMNDMIDFLLCCGVCRVVVLDSLYWENTTIFLVVKDGWGFLEVRKGGEMWN